MRKLLAVVASTIGFAPVSEHAGRIRTALVGTAVLAGTIFISNAIAKTQNGAKVDAFRRSADPFIEAVVDGLATHKQFKSYQDDLFALGAAAYAGYVFSVCTTGSTRECAKAVNYSYLGANLYLGDDDQFVRALCTLNYSVSTNYYLDLLTEMQRRTVDLSPQEKESESGKEMLRLLAVVQAEVDKAGDAYIKSPNGIPLQPGCKYAIH